METFGWSGIRSEPRWGSSQHSQTPSGGKGDCSPLPIANLSLCHYSLSNLHASCIRCRHTGICGCTMHRVWTKPENVVCTVRLVGANNEQSLHIFIEPLHCRRCDRNLLENYFPDVSSSQLPDNYHQTDMEEARKRFCSSFSITASSNCKHYEHVGLP